MNKKKTTEEFIRDAIAIHGDKYDYSKVNYVNNCTKVTITCKKCGNVFDQTPSSHLEAKGCPNLCYKVYWNKEKCEAVSKLCNGRSDFQKKYPRAYKVSHKNKWIDEFTWLDSISLKERLKETKHLIYCVSFLHKDSKYAYVGLTNDWKRRRGEHAVKGAIFNICKKLGLDIKEVLETCTEILEVGLTPREAQIMEDYWKNIRDDEGYITLNESKTGEGTGSLGNLGRKYTLEEAESILKMALQKKSKFI